MPSQAGWTLILLLSTAVSTTGAPTARLLGTAGGVVMGATAGLGTVAGIVVARARFDNHYIESTRDMRDPQLLALPALAVIGGVAGWAGPGFLTGMVAGVVGGAAAGALVGASIGALVSPQPMDRWAGGTMGAALGIVLGLGIGLLLARQRADGAAKRGRRRPARAADGVRTALLLLLAGALAACAQEVPPLPEVPPAPADGEAVESVVYLVGDPGKARYLHYPILPRLARDVERWSAEVQGDTSVFVLVLGDMVYPDGMHPPGTDGFLVDSARVASQVEVVTGPEALGAAATMLFVAGNHDWGLMEERAGARRLRNLGEFLDRVRARGPRAELVPAAGAGSPVVVDVARNLRLVLLDTAWWLFDADPAAKPLFVQGIARALATAGDRAVVIAAHHPYETAGPHGGLRPFWQTLGIRELLARSGALLQDLESRPYRELVVALEEVFARHGRPLLFAGGHEHSLQLIRHDSIAAPEYSAVSGSASKVSGVGHVDGMLFRRSAPGYMRLLVRENGAVDLYAEAAPERFLVCPDDETAEMEWERCMEEGVEAFETVFSTRIRAPHEGAASAAAGPPSL